MFEIYARKKMKKLLLAIATLLSVGATAQVNIQEFYDFGKDRQHLTTTLEMFKSDNWGSSFFFVDIDHNEKYAPSGAYAEISRAFNFWQQSKLGALSLHAEWNGGLGVFHTIDEKVIDGGYGINNCWLFGAEYFIHNQDFSNTLTLQLLYKSIANTDQDIPVQLTAVWGMSNLLGVKGLTFSGFADLWGENKTFFSDNGKSTDKTLVFLTEPQLWYCIGQHFGCDNLNIGTEIEIGCNFVAEGWQVNPCLGLKWNF